MVNKIKNDDNFRKKFYTIIFFLIFFFRQAIGYFFYSKSDSSMYYFIVGNFDFLYLIALFWFFGKKNDKRKVLFPVVLILTIMVLQIIFIDNIIVLKVIINGTKIITCFFVFFGACKNIDKIDYKFFVKLFGYACYIFLILAFIFKGSILWRHNDLVNSYNLTRLQFLYTEPSELGFHCIIVLILAIYFFAFEKNNRNRIRIFIESIIPTLLVIYFSKSMGAFCVGGVSIVFSILYFVLKKINTKKIKIAIILCMIFATLASFPIISKTSTYKRIINTFESTDYSNRYRILVPFKIVGYSLIKSNGRGIGLGNAELPENVAKYKDLGLGSAGIINSFMNFIAEGGVIALVIVIYIIIVFGKISFKQKSSLKIGLYLFIILFQLMGTYFTNPLCWLIYAFIYGYKDNYNFNESRKGKIKSE